SAGALDQLEGFASFHGADFYGLPAQQGTVTLRRESWTVPESFAFGEGAIEATGWGAGIAVADGLGAIAWSVPWLRPGSTMGKGVAAPEVTAGSALRRCSECCAGALAALARCASFRNDLRPEWALRKLHLAGLTATRSLPARACSYHFSMGWPGWLFPQTKRRLNQLHVPGSQTGIQPVRGRARDALTRRFDENAAFLQCPVRCGTLWRPGTGVLVWSAASAVGEVESVLFGYAPPGVAGLPQRKLHTTAHVYRAQADTHSIADLDQWMLPTQTPSVPAGKPFSHCPY
ncbi:MAG: DUF3025 domain-containing protein, partial [Burkholderiales bacterium]|nr:DUF3025 domain-containing protein [Burkholderiales bacterium]